jgi:hypothetical protein
MPPKPTPTKPWTFMVYMAGDNSLNSAVPADLNEMKAIGSSAALNILVQADRKTGGHGCQRYFLRKGTTLAADAVADLGTIDTGNPKNLRAFVHWAVKTYPADRYALVLWNHGAGWDDTDVYANERSRGVRRLADRMRHAVFTTAVRRAVEKARQNRTARAILFDDNAKDFLDNQELIAVLAGATKLLKRKLDILGMDACLMSMIEVGSEIAPWVDYTAGSEETEPTEGWPYQAILSRLAKRPTTTPRDFCRGIVKDYLASYVPSDGVTFSACDLSKSEALVRAVKALGLALGARLGDPALRMKLLSVRAQVQHYDTRDNVDLLDLCTLLAAAEPGTAIAAACAAVTKAVRGNYVIANGSKGDDVANSNGVAIYFPTSKISPLYAGLPFSKKTGWHKFLVRYLAAIRRR